MNLDAFLDSWDAFVADWAAADPAAADALMASLLEQGLTERPPPGVRPDEARLACEVALVRAAGALDVPRYQRTNSATPLAQRDPHLAFCQDGWREIRNPSLDFDLWWYWSEYLDPTRELVNPLVHHLAHGRHLGHAPLPVRLSPAPPPAESRPARRICLVAGYDVDGLIDDYVVTYLTELARHADVYYLADGDLVDGQLERLAGITRDAWAVRHGCYDFGSYSLLARELVGWDTIGEYDELLLVNDSCYLLRPLDEVFERMNDRACHWWGMQATARYFDGVGASRGPMPLEEAKATYLPHGLMQYTDYLHVGSYFLALRRAVIDDPGFRRRLDAVAPQPRKINVITKYEMGMTRYLQESGFGFDTFIAELYPYHPAYGPSAFTMIREGFPFLKRGFLADNPYATPDLADWKETVGELVPGADLDMIERNLLRVGAADKLAVSFSIRTRPDGTIESDEPLSRKEFRLLEARTPTYDHWWAFPVGHYDHTFASNERAVFDEVKDDPSIKKIVLTRSLHVVAEGENVVVAPLMSRTGQEYLARAGQIFVKTGPQANAHWPVPPTTHNFINLWHGTPLKRFGTAGLSMADKALTSSHRNNGSSRAVIASSKMDRLAMASTFAPLAFPDVWVTGLPRNDFILREESRLPADLRAAEQRLRDEVGDRRLVLFLPTFKDGQADAYYHFSDEEIARLGAWAEANNAVLGVREHMADKARTYSTALAPLRPINLSSRRYPDLEVLYRVADALVSDYSSCLIDFLVTGRPVISFAYDLDHYAGEERGLFYPLDSVLPGPVCRTFEELAGALDVVFTPRTPEEVEEYEWRRRIFIDRVDDQASWRVVQRVKALYLDGA